MIAIFERVDVRVPAYSGLHQGLGWFLRAARRGLVGFEVNVAAATLLSGDPGRGRLGIGRAEGSVFGWSVWQDGGQRDMRRVGLGAPVEINAAHSVKSKVGRHLRVHAAAPLRNTRLAISSKIFRCLLEMRRENAGRSATNRRSHERK